MDEFRWSEVVKEGNQEGASQMSTDVTFRHR